MLTRIMPMRPSTRPLDPPAYQAAVLCHYCGYEPPMARIPPSGALPEVPWVQLGAVYCPPADIPIDRLRSPHWRGAFALSHPSFAVGLY